MKQKLVILLTLLSLSLTFSARAAIVFADNFESYSIGPLPTNSPSTPWVGHSGNPATGGSQVIADATGNSQNALLVSQSLAQDVHADLTNQPYFSAGTNALGTPVTALYESCQIYVTTIPSVASASQTYFMHFYVDSSTFKARIFIITNGAASGTFRIAIQNGGSGISNSIPLDLNPNTPYTIVSRYVLSTGSSTVWVGPANESSGNSVTALDTPSLGNITAYAFRQNSGEGVINVDNLLVGTTFADVVPSSVNAPVILTQPQDTNVFSGSAVTFRTLAVGDPTIAYQWYYNTNTLLTDSVSIIGTTSNVLTLSNLVVGQSGTYSCVASNAAGTNITRYALLSVSPTPIAPVITNQPVNTTNIVGDTVTLSVVAGGLPAPSYQWKIVTNGVTNNVVGSGIVGTNSSTLTISNITTAQAGTYFVRITNSVGATNSDLVTLAVLPPPTLTIAQFRARVDGTYAPTNTTSLFTLQGTVTTWTNMTTSRTSTEFYMQDNTGGIAVFWTGADPTTNLPPAGAIVTVTGPMAAFSGLLEISPNTTNALANVSGVTVLSTNNPLPAPQPLPFDPNIANNLAIMKQMESMYFVASNVTLTAGATYGSTVNEPMFNNVLHVRTFSNSVLTTTFTNGAGQSFTFFINGATDIPGKSKPPGPVTMFGVLGYHTPEGFEFTPSRVADIISYTHSTNVLSNLTRLGDAPTNTFTESVLRPGETLTMTAVISDPENASVTLTPDTTGLPPSASWSGITSGLNASGVFHFTPTPADAGTNYVVALGSTPSGGSTITNYWYVYVPTVQERQIYISEFLANTTTNQSSPYFNPLHRAFDTNNILVNDQFVEIVNQSGTDLDLFGWSITDASARRHTFLIGAPSEQLAASSSNAVVVYGGPKTSDPSPPQTPVPAFPANVGANGNLGIPFSGDGVIVLRSPGYYNNGLGIQPGYIVDRIAYSGSSLSTNGSLSRFPQPNGKLRFVPQAFVNTNATTAGLQYDGSSWLQSIQTPHPVANVKVVPGNPVGLTFTADTSLVTTLWQGNTLADVFQPVAGQKFGTTSGAFSVSNSIPVPPFQFYYLTTQTNY